MSILNSTKSGKCIVPLTIHYLTEKHWRFKAHSSTSTIDYDTIWKNASHCLRIKRDNFKTIQYLFLEFETPQYSYKFTVKTVGDLDLVEEFWKKSQIRITEDAINVLKRNSENLEIEDNNLWGVSDYSISTDNIYSYTKYSDRDFAANRDFTEQPWKTKNKKTYYSHYFK